MKNPSKLSRDILRRYALAFLATAVLCAVQVAIAAMLTGRAPLHPFLLVVAACAMLLGGGPALLATIASAVLYSVFLPTTAANEATTAAADAVNVALFFAEGALISGLGHYARSSRRKATVADAALARANVDLQEAATGLQTTMRDLADREERLRLALNAGACGIWDWDMKTGAIAWSDRIYEFHGVDRESFVISMDSFINLIHADDRPMLQRAIARAVETREDYVVEFRAALPSGGTRWLATRGRVVFSAEGEPLRMLGATIDITARRRAEEDVLLAKEAAQAANQAKSMFIAHVSHELRTPLSSIIGFAEFLRNDKASPGERTEWVDTVMRNSKGLLRIVDDLLDLAKVEAGRIETRSQATCIKSVAMEVAESLRPQAEGKGLAVELTFARELPPLTMTDPVRVRQILLNLIGNAVKFTDVGMIAVSVRVSHGAAEREGPEIEICIEDTGPGIPGVVRERLFQPFSQGYSSVARKHGGSGLGLVLSQRLARLLGGDVVLVHSSPGSGSCFRLTLPVRLPRSDAAIAPSPELVMEDPPPKEARKTLAGVRIVLAEDNEDGRRYLGRALSLAGASVRAAANGRDAVKAVTDEQPDLVIMDIQMPQLDGLDATRELRTRGYEGPIIALSAHAMAEDRQRSAAAGCDVHLTKPITPQAIVEAAARFSRRNR